MINNLGGVSPLEFGAITDEVCVQLEADYSLKPARVLAGTFMTSLNGMGFSISILKLVDTGLGSGRSMLDFIDAPAEAVGWAAAVHPTSWGMTTDISLAEMNGVDRQTVKSSNLRLNVEMTRQVLTAGLQRLIAVEPAVTKYDTILGDGDCGIGLKRGATAVIEYLSRPIPEDAVKFVADLCHVVETNMDGTSGAIYAIFLNALTHGLATQDPPLPTFVSAQIWANALSTALESLGMYTPAQPGDRTLVDALVPFVKTMQCDGDIKTAAVAAQQGTQSTMGMQASLGRTVYVGGDSFKSCPDPGAFGLSEFLLGMSEASQ